MRRCTLEEVARFSGGRVIQGNPELQVDRLHTDTRTLGLGDCFVALQVDRFDGHEFVREVRGRGAVAALVSRRPIPDLPAELGLIEVPDTLEGLQRFAATYRSLLAVRTIGVTGSSGKTSTKELIASILRVRFRTKATEGNLNNHIGVPLTLIKLDPDDEFGVVEMGMNHPGEIAPLAAMTAPEIGVISSIGQAHIEFFADQAGIAEEKSALVAALPANGWAILNSEDEWSRKVAASRSTAPVIWVGNGPGSSWRTEDLRMTDEGLAFRIEHGGETVEIKLPVFNRVMATNALLAAAVGHQCGSTLAEIAEGLSAARLPGARMQVITARGAWIINDAYNANPGSMKAALQALNEFPKAKRRLAVLGSMGELGSHALALHREVGAFAGKQEIAALIVVGPNADAYRNGALEAGMKPEQIDVSYDAEEATKALEKRMLEGDAILVKGSNFMRLDQLVQAISGKDAR